jgi:nucleotide-binding universal stress UspA family protein
MDTIVVGVDDSPCAVDAIRWALEEAELRGARVRAVHAWHLPQLTPPGGRPPAGLEVEAYRQEAKRRLRTALQQAGVDDRRLEVEPVVAEAPPTEALLDAARDAILLVLGARGRGTFAGLVLGHVSHQCTLLSPCPVVVVPAEQPVAEQPRRGLREAIHV